MDAKQLQADLTQIATECRKKFPSVKQLADQAIELLNTISPKESFQTLNAKNISLLIQPFLVALDTAQQKCIQISLSNIQRFLSIRLFPEVCYYTL